MQIDMTKPQIINEIKDLMYVAESTENVYFYHSLERIKNALEEEWNNSEMYMEEIKSVLNYEQTMENLNEIKL